MSIWVSRHVQFLEAELARVRTEHTEEIKRLQEKADAELQYAREEIERLRLYAASLGGIQRAPQVSIDVEDGMSKLRDAVSQNFMGTPWQRLMQRTQAERDAEDKAKREKKQPGNGGIFDTEPQKENAKEN